MIFAQGSTEKLHFLSRTWLLRGFPSGAKQSSRCTTSWSGGVGEVYDSVRNRYFQNIGTGSFAFGCKGTVLAVSDLITPQTQFHKGFMVIIY